VFGGFAAVFTKLTQSKLFFNVYRVFRLQIIFAFANRTLQIK